MSIPFLNNIIIDDAGHIQFKTAAGANAGKINQDGNNLVLTNAVGDILLGDGSSDVFIGDGTNNVDIIFEQSGSIKGDGSAVTLTLGGANTTLNLESPNINGNLSIGATTINSKLTFTTTNGYILFDHEPSGDTGAYDGTTSVPMIKVDRAGSELVVLERTSINGAILLGNDDSVIIAAGDTRSVMRTNINEGSETVFFSAEGGFQAYGFPDNNTAWSNRNVFEFRSYDATAANNGLYIGDGSQTQFIDLSRNLKNIGSISCGAITTTSDITIPSKIIHSGDTNTYMQFEANDVWRVVTDNVERLDINTNRILVGDDMDMHYDNISTTNSGTVVKGGFLNPASEANMVHIPHVVNDLAGFNRWSNATITTSGFYATRSGNNGSYTYSNQVANDNSGWANAFDAHSSTAGSWYSDNGGDGVYSHGTDTPGVVELEWTNEAQYSLWAGIVFGSGSFTATYVKIEAYRAGAWQTLCEITDNTDQVILRQVANNSGTNAATRRLKYTLGGSVNGSYFRIHSLYMANYAAGNNNLNNTGTDTTRGVNFLERYKDGYLHGFLRAGADNTYDLGHSSYRWKNIVGVNLHGDLSGTINTNTTAATQSTSDNSTKVATTAFVKNQGYGTSNLALGTTSTTALAGNTSLLQLGTTSTTALAGDTSLLQLGTTSTTALAGNTSLLQIGTTSTTALAGNTSLLAIGTTSTTAMAGDTAIPSITGLASESYVDTAISNLVDSAPDTLDTLNELAAALGDDVNFSTTVATSIGTKVSKAGDTMTGQLLIKHDDGLGLKDTADASTSLTTLSSAPNGGNSKMLIKGGNFIHTVGFETSKNNFEYAELVSSYNGGNTQLKLYKSNSDTTATAATTTISTGASTFAGTISATNLSGTNTGDQTLPTASSLGAVTLTGTQTISGAKTFTSANHRHSGHYYMTAHDAAGNHYPHFLDGSSNGGTTINWRQYYGTSLKTHTWVSDASGNMVFTYKGAIKAEGELEGTSLDINGNADISGTLITGSSATIESSLQVKRGGGASISLRREDTGIVEGELLGEIIFTGDDPSATNTGAAIKASAADTWEMASPNEYPSILEFQTAKLATPITALTLNEDQEATFTGNLFIPGNIIHVGDTNSYFGFHGNDLWRVVTGGSERLEVSSSGLKLGNTGATVTAILDQDNMSSNSATALATQQSIKAYVDANSGSGTVTGSGSSTRLAFWNSSSALTSDGDLTYSTSSNRLSSGSFLTPNNGDYLGTDTSGDRRTLITLDSNNDVEISNSALSSGSDTNIYFGDTFRIKDGGQTRLSIDSTGDITVGGIITSKIERLPNATTGLGTGSDSNYFSKLATFSITSGQSHDDIRIILDIVGEETSHSAYAKIGIMLRKGAATNTVPDVVDLHVLSMMNANDRDSLIDPDSFYLKYSAGAAHSVDLYVKKKNTYGMLKVFENSKNLEDWQVTYYTDSNWISALPASTYTLQSQHSSGVVMTTHAFQTTGSTAGFIPLKGTIVAQSAQYYSKFQPPSGGTLERITLKNTTNTSGVIVKVYGGTTAGSQLYSTNTLSLSANTPYSINPNVLITDTDSIAINVDPGSSNATRQWQVTCFYKF